MKQVSGLLPHVGEHLSSMSARMKPLDRPVKSLSGLMNRFGALVRRVGAIA